MEGKELFASEVGEWERGRVGEWESGSISSLLRYYSSGAFLSPALPLSLSPPLGERPLFLRI